ncbi:hypothetical protein BBO99_00006190 [Phytophthora kernoviae]|uniref:Protein kinase domain-containing protein n=2 Tax=Phytophthora kernoviae TaxID=325452 RepID=A0A3R7FVM3_9STRA|nr:hypothetical protein G195_005594 [Phytophthora kernoviae 00238/432]KAG2511648.1 hypothetical protein JM18_008648 [Phytophthora kernoviae]KAG2528319.1 hypothetical protein JM16_001276 [Phytophthora kernoviae]RLM96094.1 hypothetical protein BBI17_006314 [Phytophthora kernoviae]RLN78118.1 hypothetical protein BBO99_00006190 [Phytophthora kernoviae]
MQYPKSKVASVTLGSDLISSDTSVTEVVLHNLNLQDQVDSLPNLLPSSVSVLNIGNGLIQSFPAVLSGLSSLQELYMDMNYVTSVNSSEVIDSLTYLSLQQNNLKSFTAVFPNLEYLYLNDNNFTSIPAAIYKHTKLTELYLTGNSFASMRFTQSEIDFLDNLTVLHLASTDFSVNLGCDESKKTVVHDVTPEGDAERRVQTYGGSTVSGVSMNIRTNGSRDNSKGGSVEGAQFRSVWNDPDLLSWQVREEDIEDIRQLGSGAYATVWLVRYRKSQLLASKRMRSELRSKQRTSAFIEEIKLVANFDHPNLVKFIGAAWTIESDLQVLLEYMDGGDLRDYLASSNVPLTWTSEIFGIALGIIEALVYLHSFLPPLVHRDLKSRNVLLSSELYAKLSDFGTSRFRSEENTMTTGVGTGRWLAPEVITGDGNYGTPADIYSFGVLLTELDTHEIPYSSARGANGNGLSDMAILHQVATANLRPTVSETCVPALRELVERCLVHDPSMRPAAAIVAYELRKMQKDIIGHD